MIPKMYKERRVSHRDAQLAFESRFKGKSPAEWSILDLKQAAHIVKWASVSFNTREPVKLSKSLLVREMGQRGYLKHIHSVYPSKQGHNLGDGQVTVYDYRRLMRTLVGWIKDQGMQSIDEFKLFLKAVLGDIEKSFKKKMGWFWKMVTHWFGKFTDLFMVIRKQRQNVTTIRESSIYNKARDSVPEDFGGETCQNPQARRNFSSHSPLQVHHSTDGVSFSAPSRSSPA